MARLSGEQIKRLTAAIYSHDFLHRILRQIEHLQQVVFHGNSRADWKQTRRSAEQILMAEIVTRYNGDFDGLYFALRKMENEGATWDAAIRNLAGTMQSYYTTPLGIVMRRNLFGDDAAFVSPDALEWAARE